MYCKHCGKQITDDSLYCQFCGGKQDVEEPTEKNDDKNIKLSVNSENKLSAMLTPQKKKYMILYLIWAIINIVCWIFGQPKSSGWFNPQDYFYPFTSYHFMDFDYMFDIRYYDSTEFFVYVLLIPLVIYFYVQFWHKPLMKKIKANKKQK